jgi:hypothetical protein
MRTSLYPALIACAATVFFIAGCAPTGAVSEDSGGDSGGDGSSASGVATCETYASSGDPELKLFTSTALSAGPSEGQVFGDGTELSVTLSEEAIAAGLLPQFELLRATDSGGPELISSLAFDPTTGGDGTFSTSIFEFGNDEWVGTPIVAQIFAISDQTVGDATTYGSKLLLGNYCMTYANDGS